MTSFARNDKAKHSCRALAHILSHPLTPTFTTALADSGSTDFLLRASDLPTTLSASGPTISVELPNKTTIHSLGSVDLLIPHSKVHIRAHIFPDNLLQLNIASMSQLCVQGCSATFTATSVIVTDPTGAVILSGTKRYSELLWHLPIPLVASPTPPPQAHSFTANAIHHQLDADYVQFVHASLGSPCVSTFYKAAQKGYLRTLPRVTARMIKPNPPN